MDINLYNNLYLYLTQSIYPQSSTPAEQLSIQKQARYYLVYNQLLYRHNKKQIDKPLQVIKITELEALLHNLHNEPFSGHLGRDVTFNKISRDYYWPNMYKTIAEWIKTCDICQRQGAPQ